jgi:hypothetical protein
MPRVCRVRSHAGALDRIERVSIIERGPGFNRTGLMRLRTKSLAPQHEISNCARLKDKTRNGNRELKDTLHHLATEFLVLWAWNPGTRLNGEPRMQSSVAPENFKRSLYPLSGATRKNFARYEFFSV